MKLRDRSPKSLEKFADGLMSVGNTLHSAVFLSVLVFPLTTFLSSAFSGSAIYSPLAVVMQLSWGDVALFGASYLLPIGVGYYAKEEAMRLYDGIR